jgi:hypothetical protein
MKKKYVNAALIYALAAMAAGVFYREFTKACGFSGVTMLSKAHGHLFMLGMMVFLLVALIAGRLPVEKEKSFHAFLVLYNIGVPLTAVMMIVRGITQVLATPLSASADAMIAGIAGIGHILAGLGLICLLSALRKHAD